MTDTLNKEHRSWVMSRIRSRDTKPELFVRSLLHRSGYRFSLKTKSLPGKPDFVLPRYKVAVFIHGCFWHRHSDPDCPIAKVPKSNVRFWKKKLTTNTQRDQISTEALHSQGWTVITAWECEVSQTPLLVLERLLRVLEDCGGKRTEQVPLAGIDSTRMKKVAEARHRYNLNKQAGTRRYEKAKNS